MNRSRKTNSSGNGRVNVLAFRLEGAQAPWCAVRDDHAFLSVTLGRGTECDLSVPADAEVAWTVSRMHARLSKSDEGYWVEDLGSKNLTQIDGRLVFSPRRVQFPCTLKLGELAVSVTREELPHEAYHALLPLEALPESYEATAEISRAPEDQADMLESLRRELREARLFELLVEGA